MGNNMHKDMTRRKVQWMRDHRELWADLDPNEALYMTQRERWRAIANGLKAAGLFSNTTTTIDVPVRDLIKAAMEPDSPEPNTRSLEEIATELTKAIVPRRGIQSVRIRLLLIEFAEEIKRGAIEP